MATNYHKMYMEHSPEYRNTVTRWGRNLTPVQVEDILIAHSFSVRDLLDDTSDDIASGPELPATLDAALLYAWLGY